MPVIRDTGEAANAVSADASASEYDDFLVAAHLLQAPRLARIFVYVCYAGPTTVEEVVDVLELKRATTYEDVEQLEEIGAIERDDSTRPHRITASGFAYVDPDGVAITPTVLHAVALREIDDDVEYVYNRYGVGTVAAAVRLAAEYYAGQLTQRMVASDLGVESVEAASLLNALEGAIAAGTRHDPYFHLVAGDAAEDVETDLDASSDQLPFATQSDAE